MQIADGGSFTKPSLTRYLTSPTCSNLWHALSMLMMMISKLVYLSMPPYQPLPAVNSRCYDTQKEGSRNEVIAMKTLML